MLCYKLVFCSHAVIYFFTHKFAQMPNVNLKKDASSWNAQNQTNVPAHFNYIEKKEHLSPVICSATIPTKWYAIYTRSRFEKKIYRALQKSEFEAFLPLIKEKRVWSDRLKTVEMPLLPSYVFVKLPKNKIHYIYNYPGFVRFVCFEGKPCVIKEEEIVLMEKIVTHGFPVEKSSHCGVGDYIRVIRGPLKGWEGRVECNRNKSKIVFVIEGIGQAISVEVGMENVERLVDDTYG